jgi:hypothetical protein
MPRAPSLRFFASTPANEMAGKFAVPVDGLLGLGNGEPRSASLHGPHVVLTRQTPHPTRNLQLENRRKHLRRSQLRLKQLKNLVELQRFI